MKKYLEIGSEKVHSNLGSDWDRMDIVSGNEVDINHDLRVFPYPIESNTYEIIYMSHVLEHIPWTQTKLVLDELYRILKPNGILEIWVPDLEKLVNAYINNSLIKNDGWYKLNPDKDPTRWFNGRLFTYGPGDENFHRAAFDKRYLIKCLMESHFKNIEQLISPRGINHGWINLGIKSQK